MYCDVWYQEVLENVSVKKEAREAQQSKDVIVVAEFSEKYGPIALKMIPEQEESAVQDIENFVVQVMAVDYSGSHAGVPMYQPRDSSMLLKNKRRIAFIHYFTLHDVDARGYARIFTLSYMSLSVKRLRRNIESLRHTFSTIARLCHTANKLVFYREMCNKLENTNDSMESSQTRWWLQQIEQRHNIAPHTLPVHTARAMTYEDYNSGSRIVLIPRVNSLSSGLDQAPSKRTIYAKDHHKDREKDLRTLQQLCPLEYEYMCRSLQQLYVTSGQSSCLRFVKEAQCLSAARYNVQFPLPTFDRRPCNPLYSTDFVVFSDSNANYDLQTVGQSEFYTDKAKFNSSCLNVSCINCSKRFLETSECDDSCSVSTLGASPQSIDSPITPIHPGNTIPYNSKFSPDSVPLFAKQGKVACINPDTIARDLLFFRKELGPAAAHVIYALLSGKPLLILGSDVESRYLLNAASVFVTKKERVCHTIKKMFSLADLTQYSVIQVENSVDIMRDVNCYSSKGLCCVVSHDKRSLNAPRYEGSLIQEIWAWYPNKRVQLVELGEDSLLALVQAGLMSLMSDVLVLYYSALHTPECDPDTTDLEPCDRDIALYQLYSSLHQPTPSLNTSHSLNLPHKIG